MSGRIRRTSMMHFGGSGMIVNGAPRGDALQKRYHPAKYRSTDRHINQNLVY
jgi:hypothetical protein